MSSTPLPGYIHIPSAASTIPAPREPSQPRLARLAPTFPPQPDAAAATSSLSSSASASATAAALSGLPSTSSSSSGQAPGLTRKFSVNVPSTSSLSTNVSDLLLSSLLPPNLPKLPAARSGSSSGNSSVGRARELTTQREGLGLNLLSNNFRRFITRVGPVFWLQDRVEEVLFWQKPMWTWAWLLFWTFTCFQPRILLLIPSLVLVLILVGIQEQRRPLPSLFGVTLPPVSSGTSRLGAGTDGSYSASTAPESEGAPVVPPKEAESGVDYYMNIQAIQNLMGLVSDMYDWIVPRLTQLSGASTSPTGFPLTPTHLILLLLPPTLILPLTPPTLIPYLLLPLGIAPPLFFHPNLTSSILSLPRSKHALLARARLEDIALTDGLSDDLGRRKIARVQVWENERLDPVVAAKPVTAVAAMQGAWSGRFLRPGERSPWVKVRAGSSAGSIMANESSSLWAEDEEGAAAAEREGGRMVLALKDKWAFVPREDWRVDVCGLWSDVGTDHEGWAYSDDAWQNAAPSDEVPVTASGTVSATAGAVPGSGVGPTTSAVTRRVTRRRRWWRRVYLDDDDEGVN